jgi:restriction system protein
MELLALLVVAAVMIYALSQRGRQRVSKKDEENDKARKRVMSARLDYFRSTRAKIEKAAEPHLELLRTKCKQLIYEDDYGNVVDDEWQRELRYFLERANLGSTPRYVSPEEDQRFRLGALMTVLNRHFEKTPDPQADVMYSPSCSGVEFENAVESILCRSGAQVRRTPTTGDQGVDLLARVQGRLIAIQCKRSASPVGNKAVQEAHAGQQFYDADEAWVVSDAPFTRSARQLAGTIGVELIDFRQIDEKVAS